MDAVSSIRRRYSIRIRHDPSATADRLWRPLPDRVGWPTDRPMSSPPTRQVSAEQEGLRSAAWYIAIMNPHKIVPVVLSGGSGTRLWPSSRKASPKQLLPLAGDTTMLHDTLTRVADVPGRSPAVVVCNATQLAPVQREMRLAGDANGTVIVEPEGRNTAPAVAVAAAVIDDPDAIMLVMPADHVIRDRSAFAAAVATGAVAAADGALVTFGIVPDHPATGYGYLEVGATTGAVAAVARFVEKPDLPTAEEFLAGGNHLWNSGMFMFTTARYLAELLRFEPEMHAASLGAVRGARVSDGVVALEAAAFAASPSNSIDYAVMERTDDAVVVSLDAGWNDLGVWSSVYEVGEADGDGTVKVGDVLATDVRRSYLRSDAGLLAVIGLDDIVAVSTPDAVLITHRERTEDVKAVVEALREAHRPEADEASRQIHPWGSSTVLQRTESSTVERIDIDFGGQMELTEGIWVVMDGVASTEGGTHQPGALVPGTVVTAGTGPLSLLHVSTGSETVS